jgi:hypothetical protein
LVALDISDPGKPVEVSRVVFGEDERPHWIAKEPSGNRIVVSGGGGDLESRLMIATIDMKTGKLALDVQFPSQSGKQGWIGFDRQAWPHGNTGRGIPHGAVFSRN